MVLLRKQSFLTKDQKNMFMFFLSGWTERRGSWKEDSRWFIQPQNRKKRFLTSRQLLVYPAAESKEEVPDEKTAVGLSSGRIERRGSWQEDSCWFIQLQNRKKRFLTRRQPLVYPAAESKEEVPDKKTAVGLSSRRIDRRGSWQVDSRWYIQPQNRKKRFLTRRKLLVHPAAEFKDVVPG